MTSDLMTLRDLRVQTFKERKEGRLTKLPVNFYGKLRELEGQIRKLVSEEILKQVPTIARNEVQRRGGLGA